MLTRMPKCYIIIAAVFVNLYIIGIEVTCDSLILYDAKVKRKMFILPNNVFIMVLALRAKA